MSSSSPPDIHVNDLRRLILRLPERQPLTDDYEAERTVSVWYRSQQEHLAGWLEEYNGPGAYNRKNPSISSKHFYNHLRCAPGLMWLAEALGEDPEVLRAGISDVRAAGPNPSSQCAAFRRSVPWPRIVELVEASPQFRPGLLSKVRGIVGPRKSEGI